MRLPFEYWSLVKIPDEILLFQEVVWKVFYQFRNSIPLKKLFFSIATNWFESIVFKLIPNSVTAWINFIFNSFKNVSWFIFASGILSFITAYFLLCESKINNWKTLSLSSENYFHSFLKTYFFISHWRWQFLFYKQNLRIQRAFKILIPTNRIFWIIISAYSFIFFTFEIWSFQRTF